MLITFSIIIAGEKYSGIGVYDTSINEIFCHQSRHLAACLQQSCLLAHFAGDFALPMHWPWRFAKIFGFRCKKRIKNGYQLCGFGAS